MGTPVDLERLYLNDDPGYLSYCRAVLDAAIGMRREAANG